MKRTVLALAAAVLIALPAHAHPSTSAQGCLHSADAVRAAAAGAWPSWSTRIPGHMGERCWFPQAGRKVVQAERSAKLANRMSDARLLSTSAAGGATPATTGTQVTASAAPPLTPALIVARAFLDLRWP